MKIAAAYAQGSDEYVRLGFFRTPTLVIKVGDGRAELRRATFMRPASMFRLPRSRPCPRPT